MLLCIDVGNTQIALGIYADDRGGVDEVRPPLVRDWRMRTEPGMTADELEVALRALLGPYASRVTGSVRIRQSRTSGGRTSSTPPPSSA